MQSADSRPWRYPDALASYFGLSEQEGIADAQLQQLPPILANVTDPDALPVMVRSVGGGG